MGKYYYKDGCTGTSSKFGCKYCPRRFWARIRYEAHLKECRMLFNKDKCSWCKKKESNPHLKTDYNLCDRCFYFINKEKNK